MDLSQLRKIFKRSIYFFFFQTGFYCATFDHENENMQLVNKELREDEIQSLNMTLQVGSQTCTAKKKPKKTKNTIKFTSSVSVE